MSDVGIDRNGEYGLGNPKNLLYALVTVLLLSASMLYALSSLLDLTKQAVKSANLIASIIYSGFFLLFLVSIVCSIWLTPKAVLLLHGYICHCLRNMNPSSVFQTHAYPLPQQEIIVEELQRACGIGNGDSAAATVALRGTWGSGKTACVRLFRERTANNEKVAVIYVNIWQFEMEPQPELAIYRAIVSDWKVLWPYGWLAVPAWKFLLAFGPQTMQVVLNLGKNQVKLDNLAVRATSPLVLWQQQLKSFVGASRKRLVLVLDDLDRCSPIAAQRYITLVRRFLAIPNISVVIPYVQEQLRYKAFNPMLSGLPDLSGTMEAALWDAFGDGFGEAEKAREEGSTAQKVDGSKSSEEGKAGADGNPPPSSIASFASAMADVLRRQRNYLVKQYISASPAKRERISALAEDKYIADRIIRLDTITPGDFAWVVALHWRAKGWITRYIAHDEETKDLWIAFSPKEWLAIKPSSQAGDDLQTILEAVWTSNHEETKPPVSIRQLFATLDLAVSAYRPSSMERAGKLFTLPEPERARLFFMAMVVMGAAVRYGQERVNVKGV